MASNYGYDPSQYVNDYSWIGKIGESISKFAYQVPEIVQLNKTVKENKKAKDVLYSSVNRYIDKLDKNIVSNIVSSMGIQLDVNDPNYERSAREALKKNIPTFSEVTKNEDYAKQIVDYFVPVIKAAQSDAGGGPLKFSDLMSGIDNNQIVEGVNQTTFGKQQLEEEKYQQGREREQSEYNTGFARKYGAGGELETAGSIGNATDMNRTRQTDEYKTDVNNAVTKIVDQATTMVNAEYEDRPVSFMDFDKRRNKALAKVVSLAKDNPTINVEAAKEQIRSEYDDIWSRLVKSKEIDIRQRAEANDLKIAQDKAKQAKIDDTNPKVTEQQLAQANKDKLRERDNYTREKTMLEGRLTNKNIKPEIKKEFEKRIRDLDGKIRYLDSYATQTQNTLTDFGSVTGPDAGRRSAATQAVKLNQMESDIDRTIQMLSDYKETTINANKKGKGAIERVYKKMVEDGVAGEPGQGRPFVLYEGKIALNPQYNAYKEFLQTGKRPSINQVYSPEKIKQAQESGSGEGDKYSANKEKIRVAQEAIRDPNAPPEIKQRAQAFLDSLGR